MRVLVFGAGGQLASALLATVPPGIEASAVTEAELDIRDRAAVEATVRATRPGAIVNAAAYTAVDQAESDADRCFAVNRDGAGNIAAAAAEFGAFLVHISTDFVFDGRSGTPYRTGDAPNPLSVYGRSKLEGELLVRTHCRDSAIIRTAWLYAATGKNFVRTMLHLMATKPSLRVVADQVGSPTHARGLARACWAAIERRAVGYWHWTDAGVASWYDFAVAIADLGEGSACLLQHPDRAIRAPRDYLDAGPAAGLQRARQDDDLGGPRAGRWCYWARARLQARRSRRLPMAAGSDGLAMLVTGGAGFIGVNFVRHRLARSPKDRIVVLDALTYAGNRASLADVAGRIEFVHGDIRDTPLVERLLREHGLSTIVHFAAESHVDRSIAGPDAFIDANVNGTHSLLKAARAVWLGGSGTPHRFHPRLDRRGLRLARHRRPRLSETNQYQPNSPYSASKAASDHLVRAYHHTFAGGHHQQLLEQLRPVSVPGEAHPPHARQHPAREAAAGVRRRDERPRLALCRRPLRRHLPDPREGPGRRGLQHRRQQRAAQHRDREAALRHGRRTLRPRRVACQAASRVTWAASGKPSESLITYVKDRPGHDRRYAIDASKAERELGYRPGETFATGFAKTIDWYLAHESWWRAVMDGSYRNWIETNYAGRGTVAAS